MNLTTNKCALILLALGASLLVFGSFAHAESLIPESERRSPEQTYLTYPEWFLVHSPTEYGALTMTRPAHEFPFIKHIGQLWSSYAAVTKEQIKSGYPTNAGYHLMILVISTSTSLEYLLRSLYENTLGRCSYFLSSGQSTREEAIGAENVQKYVKFIQHEPWYLFDFKSCLKELWINIPILGKNPLRKLERRYALTTEYLIKIVYAKLIELATHAAYEDAKMTTWVVVSGFDSHAQLPEHVKLQHYLGQGRAVLILPRYEAFWHAAQGLAKQGINFEDIAGNDGNILVTTWHPVNQDNMQTYPILFKQPLITQPPFERLALKIPVHQLALYLRTDARIEHIYDY